MRKLLNTFLTSFGLICRIPIPVKYNFDFSLFPLFFPLIGLIVSGLGFCIFLVFNPILSFPGTTTFIILTSQYLVFNLFHFDGLLDCADALLFNTSKKKRLLILTDKRTGSFAIFSGAVYLIFKFYLLKESINILNTGDASWLGITILLFYPLSGRIAGALMPAAIPAADDPGLAELLKGYSQIALTIGIVLSFSASLTIGYIVTDDPVQFFISLFPYTGAFAGGILVSLISKKLLGGYTGDSIGLAIETGELFHLIIAVEILGRLF